MDVWFLELNVHFRIANRKPRFVLIGDHQLIRLKYDGVFKSSYFQSPIFTACLIFMLHIDCHHILPIFNPLRALPAC